MKSQITRFTFAGKCERDSAIRCDSATLDKPTPAPASKRRREVWVVRSAGMRHQRGNGGQLSKRLQAWWN
jgi:hypothetical protein